MNRKGQWHYVTTEALNSILSEEYKEDRSLFREMEKGTMSLYIPLHTFIESFEYFLLKSKKLDHEIFPVFESLLETEQVEVEEKEVLFSALQLWKETWNGGDIADLKRCYINEKVHSMGMKLLRFGSTRAKNECENRWGLVKNQKDLHRDNILYVNSRMIQKEVNKADESYLLFTNALYNIEVSISHDRQANGSLLSVNILREYLKYPVLYDELMEQLKSHFLMLRQGMFHWEEKEQDFLWVELDASIMIPS